MVVIGRYDRLQWLKWKCDDNSRREKRFPYLERREIRAFEINEMIFGDFDFSFFFNIQNDKNTPQTLTKMSTHSWRQNGNFPLRA